MTKTLHRGKVAVFLSRLPLKSARLLDRVRERLRHLHHYLRKEQMPLNQTDCPVTLIPPVIGFVRYTRSRAGVAHAGPLAAT